MCKINILYHTCRHRLEHTYSSCRGLKKVAPDSSTPACRKTPSLWINTSHKCGNCSRADAEEDVYRELGLTRNQPLTETEQTTLDERLAEAVRNIPTTNWRLPAPPVYGRRPSQSRSVTPRKASLLRMEVMAEDISGPEAWESNIVPASEDFIPIYETVCNGWSFELTPETKSLAEELEEDAAELGTEVESDQDEDDYDQSEEDEGEPEVDGELRMYEGDDMLLLAHQTPLPLDPEVDGVHDDRHAEGRTSPPTTADDTPMSAQQYDIFSTEAANSHLKIFLDTASSSTDSQHLSVLEREAQHAESTVEKGKLPHSQSPRVTKPYGPSLQPAGDNRVRYWYKQHKSGSSNDKNEVGCWELISVALA